MIVLNDYILCFDGSVIIDPSKLFKYASHVDLEKVQLTELTPDIRKYNSMSSPNQRLKVWDPDKKIDLPPVRWLLDSSIKKLSDAELFEHICYMYKSKVAHKHNDPGYLQASTSRLLYEWKLFIQNGLIYLLRALLSAINTMTHNNVCWGPGRGSSTSSYILFIIGLHDVDCVEYDVDVHDFIKR